MKQANVWMDQMGIDRAAAIKVLILALVAGIVGALIDRILELPTGALAFWFGGFVAAINGPTYAFIKGRPSRSALLMSAVSGLVAFFAWWLITKLIGDRDMGFYEYNPADGINLLEALITGILVGLISYGWFALIRRLPDDLLSMRR